MKKLVKSIEIAADQRTVWETVVDPLKYEVWTKAFGEGCYFEGSWNTGDAIRFLARNQAGQPEGMVSEIADARYPEFISIRHIGVVHAGMEDRSPERVGVWANAYENYLLEPLDGEHTRFTVDMDIEENDDDMFEEMWPAALASLKAVSEACFRKPMAITVRVVVARPLSVVWDAFTKPEHITGWNFASDDWWCPKAENQPETNGRFKYTMSSKDGKMSFDFSGKYIEVIPQERIISELDDQRSLSITFKTIPEGIMVEETFTAEGENTLTLQREGWQAILKNFAAYVTDRF